MRQIRSFIAVFIGYVFLVTSLYMFDVTANILDPSAIRPTVSLLLASTVFKVVAALIAGLITASIAKRKRLAHAGALAVASIMVALIQFDQTGLIIPIWAQSIGIVAVFSGIILGGWLRTNFGSYLFDSSKEDDINS